MAASGEVSTRGDSAVPAPLAPAPPPRSPPGVVGASGQGAAAAGHSRGHLLRGDGQRHCPAPGPSPAGGGGRGRRRLPDKSVHILTVDEGQLETRFPKAHSSALNCVLPIDNHIFATGDDGGVLKVWDLRKGNAVLEAHQQEEYISAMAVDGNGKILLTTSGDGTLGVFNVKRRRFELLSEPQNGDLTSVVLLKRGKKVACGSSEGTIYLFNWDGFGAASDRFALRAESVDCMVPIMDSIVCVGSLDGVIRAVNILPNRVLGCVGQHLGEPIEQLAVAPGGQLLASCAHDQKVKFWDISALGGLVVDDYRKKKKKGGPLRALSSKAAGSREEFFADLRDEAEPEAAAGSDSDGSD
ncbi:WD repeat-containing protein 55 isoform X2 [Ciconia boyciana]|uniref:WD repeat-containing protein 55 isoform X2 n=1 Tax=Ciconia boyciana TaxID=52775 RepID=UPI003B9E05EB